MVIRDIFCTRCGKIREHIYNESQDAWICRICLAVIKTVYGRR